MMTAMAIAAFLAASPSDRMGGADDFRLIFTLLGVTMSQKSSVNQIANLVPWALTPDTLASAPSILK
ncbi:MAG: hypothetical protein ACOVN5_15365 [Aquidulcibacter sp.]|jgi:hypothetical protein